MRPEDKSALRRVSSGAEKTSRNGSGTGGKVPSPDGTGPTDRLGTGFGPCKCRQSHCLKLYCVCFANKVFCNGCACIDCANTEDNIAEVEKRRGKIQHKNPHAFRDKKDPDQVKGCNCVRSQCLKCYCECFAAKKSCTAACRCTDCDNTYGRRPGSEGPPPPKAPPRGEHTMRSTSTAVFDNASQASAEEAQAPSPREVSRTAARLRDDRRSQSSELASRSEATKSFTRNASSTRPGPAQKGVMAAAAAAASRPVHGKALGFTLLNAGNRQRRRRRAAPSTFDNDPDYDSSLPAVSEKETTPAPPPARPDPPATSAPPPPPPPRPHKGPSTRALSAAAATRSRTAGQITSASTAATAPPAPAASTEPAAAATAAAAAAAAPEVVEQPKKAQPQPAEPPSPPPERRRPSPRRPSPRRSSPRRSSPRRSSPRPAPPRPAPALEPRANGLLELAAAAEELMENDRSRYGHSNIMRAPRKLLSPRWAHVDTAAHRPAYPKRPPHIQTTGARLKEALLSPAWAMTSKGRVESRGSPRAGASKRASHLGNGPPSRHEPAYRGGSVSRAAPPISGGRSSGRAEAPSESHGRGSLVKMQTLASATDDDGCNIVMLEELSSDGKPRYYMYRSPPRSADIDEAPAEVLGDPRWPSARTRKRASSMPDATAKHPSLATVQEVNVWNIAGSSAAAAHKRTSAAIGGAELDDGRAKRKRAEMVEGVAHALDRAGVDATMQRLSAGHNGLAPIRTSKRIQGKRDGDAPYAWNEPQHHRQGRDTRATAGAGAGSGYKRMYMIKEVFVSGDQESGLSLEAPADKETEAKEAEDLHPTLGLDVMAPRDKGDGAAEAAGDDATPVAISQSAPQLQTATLQQLSRQVKSSAKQAWLLTPRSERTEGKIADLLYSPQPVSLQSLQSISEGHDDHPILMVPRDDADPRHAEQTLLSMKAAAAAAAAEEDDYDVPPNPEDLCKDNFVSMGRPTKRKVDTFGRLLGKRICVPRRMRSVVPLPLYADDDSLGDGDVPMHRMDHGEDSMSDQAAAMDGYAAGSAGAVKSLLSLREGQ